MSFIQSDLASKSPVRSQGRRSRYVYRIAGTSAIAGFLFGFDTAVINGALIYLKRDFQLTDFQVELAASSLLTGSMAGCALAGLAGNHLGRKPALIAAAILFCASSVATALPHSFVLFGLARFIAGIAIGMASVLAPMYIAEIAPARIRGRLVNLNQLAIVTGILAAYLVSWWLSPLGTVSWRWMFAVAAIPSFLFALALLTVPESPRWLFLHGFSDRALRVLARIYSPEEAAQEALEVQQSLQQKLLGTKSLLDRRFRRPLLIGITIAVLSQITGINAVIYYGSIIMDQYAGQSDPVQAIGANVLIGLANLIFTIVAMFLIDRVGRKPMLLGGSAGMCLSLILLGVGFRAAGAHIALVLSLTVIYVSFFALSIGATIWVYIAELFPTEARGAAMSLSTFALWLACLAVTLSFLTLAKLLTASGVFWLFAAMCFVLFVFVLKVTPETKGKTLEEIARMWEL